MKNMIRCGCGKLREQFDKRGRERYYIKGHTKVGFKFSKESLKKMSEAHKGQISVMKGKLMSLESRKKMSEAHKGKKLTKEHKMNISDSLKGEKGPGWLGGKSFEPYDVGFNKQLKEQIRQRDNHRCQQCFRHQDELFKNTKAGIRQYKLYIHHIDYNKQNNNPNNLISLCLNCHTQTNFKRDDWIEYFKERLIKE